MATETAERVTSEPLKELILWTERIVKIDPSPTRTSARRALMLGFALTLDRALGLALGTARARDHAYARPRGIDLDRARALAVGLALALDLDRAYARARARDRAPVSGLDLTLDEAERLSRMIMEDGMIRAEGIAGLDEGSNTLDRILSHTESLTGSLLQKLVNALEGLANVLDIPRLASGLPDSDARQRVKFLICNRRILECREAAERVTQAGWDRVCERLIALPGST
jgi:hypothetical protein